MRKKHSGHAPILSFFSRFFNYSRFFRFYLSFILYFSFLELKSNEFCLENCSRFEKKIKIQQNPAFIEKLNRNCTISVLKMLQTNNIPLENY